MPVYVDYNNIEEGLGESTTGASVRASGQFRFNDGMYGVCFWFAGGIPCTQHGHCGMRVFCVQLCLSIDLVLCFHA